MTGGSFQTNTKRIDHIVVAAQDIALTLQFMQDELGGMVAARNVRPGRPWSAAAIAPSYCCGRCSRILGRFVERHGPGIVHIAVEVFDIEGAACFLDAREMRFSGQFCNGGRMKQLLTERNAGSAAMFEFREHLEADCLDEGYIRRRAGGLPRIISHLAAPCGGQDRPPSLAGA